MVNTLSGSVSAYRKEIVKPRFIRIDEVMALLDVTRDEAMDIALAAGARYQLAKIILVHKERLMKFMKHFARVPSSNKIVEKKFVRIGEASMTYSIGHHRFIEMARAAGAVAKLIAKEGKSATLKLPSGEVRLISKNCSATVGQVGNVGVNQKSLGRAGSKRWLGKRPVVRGVVMNPVDHPHGGGEGKAPIGRKKPTTPWGYPALGRRSRKRNKYSDNLILRRRSK